MTFDRGVAVGVFLFSMAMLASAIAMPRSLIRQIVGPEVLPILLMGCLAVASVVLFLRGGPPRVKPPEPKAPRETAKADGQTQARVVAGVALYILIFQALGYVISTALLCIYETAVFEPRHWTRNLLVGAGFSLSVYVIFVKFLNVSLPKGPLGW